MPRRVARDPGHDPQGRPPTTSSDADPTDSPDSVDSASQLPLDGLGVVGITRRRVAWLLAAIVATWIVIVFARQVGEAQAAAATADAIASRNAALAANVTALQQELETIQQPAFVEQQAAANGLGRPNERPFRLAPGAAPLPPGAPGSTEVRLGGRDDTPTPLESWLDLLFGAGSAG
jgi:cell division protein FtsB